MDFCYTTAKKKIVFNWGLAEVSLLMAVGQRCKKEVAQLIMTEAGAPSIRSSEALAKSIRKILDYIHKNAKTLGYSYGFVNPMSGENSFGGGIGGIKIGRHFYGLETGYGVCRLTRY